MNPWFAFVAASVLAAAPGDQTFPYKAYITTDDVYVRSGPGRNYYPTAKLAEGDVVEVYRHDPGGWYAIRPPEGSFTWVSGRLVEPGEKGIGTVTGDRVAARVGSQFSDIRDVIQVRLHQGESIEILASHEFGSTPGSGLWYKISPPSGEFRWVSGKFVDPDYSDQALRKTSADANPLVPQKTDDSSRHDEDPIAVASSMESAQRDSQVLTADHVEPVAEASAPTDRDVAAEHRSVEASKESEPPRTNELTTPARDPGGPQSIRQRSPEEFQKKLDDLEMELAIMLAEEPTVWQFDEMAFTANELLAEAETALERGRARLLVRRLTHARQIKQRHDSLHGLQAASERQDRQVAALSRANENVRSVAAVAQSKSRFDGAGRLARVVSPKVGAPRYALVDANGDVRCFVTPAPGVNMRYYVGKQVGVTGTRGFITEQQAQHVMAKHVTLLDHARR